MSHELAFAPALELAARVRARENEDGLPIDVQFVGKPFGEGTLFRLAAQLEQARPWIGLRPQVC
jgi:amidase